jgi:pimeloyl-ACP methyl ester carboxylesterase
MQNAGGLEYEVYGEGEPVLLIHGSHVADAFLPLTREPVLADRFCLVRYHRRGFAGSARHSGPFTIEQQARDALLPVRHLGIDRFHVVGHSYGAVTALQLAVEAPQSVHSLVLLEPPATMKDETTAIAEMFAPLIERYRSGDASGAVTAFMGLACGPDWRAIIGHSVPGGPEQAERDAATFFETEVLALPEWGLGADQARRLSQPILYIMGGESGDLFDRPKQLFMSAVPHAEEVILPGLNHLLQMQDSGLVARPIADFLLRHPL